MPIYGYECGSCRVSFETVQSIKDAPLTTCESCGGELRKLIYPVGIAFKGSGFYVNDYASSGNKPDEKSAAPADPAKAEAPKDAAPQAEAPKSDAPKADAPATAAA